MMCSSQVYGWTADDDENRGSKVRIFCVGLMRPICSRRITNRVPSRSLLVGCPIGKDKSPDESDANLTRDFLCEIHDSRFTIHD